jgi:chromosome partitioning protein
VIAASDLILIPVQPYPYDIWAAEEPLKLINEVSKLDRSRDAAIVINRKQATTALGKQARANLEHLPAFTLQSEIAQRIAFAESTASGQLASELQPRSRAAQEIRALVDELETANVR